MQNKTSYPKQKITLPPERKGDLKLLKIKDYLLASSIATAQRAVIEAWGCYHIRWAIFWRYIRPFYAGFRY